jgi:hypothetical protein
LMWDEFTVSSTASHLSIIFEHQGTAFESQLLVYT